MYRFKYPSSIGLFLTWKCNLRCRHCLVDSGDKGEELGYSDWCRIVDYALHRQIVCIDLTGGEPTLVPYFADLVEYAWERGAKVTVATNGLGLDRETAVRIRDKIQSIRVSLDGPDARTHEWLRGEGTFEKTLRKIELLVSLGLPCYAVTVAHRKNYESLDRMPETLRSVGLTLFQILPFIPVGRGNHCRDIMLTPDEWRDLLLYARERPGGVEWYIDTPLTAILDGQREGALRTCLAGFYYLGILPNGDVIPCPIMELTVGNVRAQDLDDLWSNSAVLATIRDPGMLADTCTDCSFVRRCNGGCRALAYHVGGSLKCPDPFCWIAYPNV